MGADMGADMGVRGAPISFTDFRFDAVGSCTRNVRSLYLRGSIVRYEGSCMGSGEEGKRW